MMHRKWKRCFEELPEHEGMFSIMMRDGGPGYEASYPTYDAHYHPFTKSWTSENNEVICNVYAWRENN